VPLQHSLLARRGSLRATRVIRHPTLRSILHVEAFCAVGAVLPVSRGAPISPFRPTVTLLKKETILQIAERRGGTGLPRGLPTQE
jgi:hypothetical protein